MSLQFLAWMPGTVEWVVIAIVALLIFGRRLPDVARSVGKSIVEFKKGMRDVKDEIEERSRLDSGEHRNRLEQGENRPKDRAGVGAANSNSDDEK